MNTWKSLGKVILSKASLALKLEQIISLCKYDAPQMSEVLPLEVILQDSHRIEEELNSLFIDKPALLISHCLAFQMSIASGGRLRDAGYPDVEAWRAPKLSIQKSKLSGNAGVDFESLSFSAVKREPFFYNALRVDQINLVTDEEFSEAYELLCYGVLASIIDSYWKSAGEYLKLGDRANAYIFFSFDDTYTALGKLSRVV